MVIMFLLFYLVSANLVKPNTLLKLPFSIDNAVVETRLALDANWRWLRYKDNYDNCFSGSWNTNYCPDPIKCLSNCVLEGVSLEDWKIPYGVESTSKLSLQFVTQGPYGTNIGSRLYVVDPSKNEYLNFKLLGKEFSFTVDMSQIVCGMNSAMYFVEMKGIDVFGGAEFGTGYGDAQCPKDIKYARNFVNTNNTGICANELDIWEANKYAYAFTPHPCSKNSICTNDKDCGTSNRYSGFCDKDGADYNPFRLGNTKLYGPGLQVDTNKPFTVRTLFHTDLKGDLIRISRLFEQEGKVIDGGFLTDETADSNKKQFTETNHFRQLGGLKQMGESMKRGMVLVISLWDDASTKMAWLDGVFPPGSTSPGSKRGPCPSDKRDPSFLRSTFPNAKVLFSNFKVSDITSSPVPTPTPIPTPTSPPAGMVCCRKMSCTCDL